MLMAEEIEFFCYKEKKDFTAGRVGLMAQLMNEMEWGEPILPAVADPEWEAKVKAEMGTIPDLMTRVSRSRWLREPRCKCSGTLKK